MFKPLPALRLIIFSIFIFSFISYGGTKIFSINTGAATGDSIKDYFQIEVNHLKKSMLFRENAIIDSLQNIANYISTKSAGTLKNVSDSILTVNKESLSAARFDSLKITSGIFTNNLNSFIGDELRSLNTRRNVFKKTIRGFPVLGFNEVGDVRNALSDIQKDFNDSLFDSISDFKENLSDTLSTLRDSLGDYSDALINNQSDEDDIPNDLDNDSAASFVLSTGYTGHVQFKGYDNGIKQAGYVPNVIYNNPAGFSIYVSAAYLTADESFDEAEFGGEYNWNFVDFLSGSVSYTHYFFGSNSSKVNVGLTNDAGVGLSLTTPVVEFNPSFDLLFGNKTDYSLEFSLTHQLTLAQSFDSTNVLFIAPSLSADLGTQNFLNSALRIKKTKKKIVTKTVETSNSVFAIMVYEFDLPLTYQFGNFSIVFEYSYLFPINQPVNEQSSSFGFFSMNLSLTLQ